jgi:hypothetical protein
MKGGAEQRSESARKAVLARWAKTKAVKKGGMNTNKKVCQRTKTVSENHAREERNR